MTPFTFRSAALWLAMGIGVGACRSDKLGPTPVQVGDAATVSTTVDAGIMASSGAAAAGVPGTVGQPGVADGGAGAAGVTVIDGAAGSASSGQGSADGAVIEGCEATDETAALGVASARLNAAPPLKLSASVQLIGDGLSSTLMPQQFGQARLRWRGGRMFMLADTGFWDVPVAGKARWYPTPTVGVLGIDAADMDGDGDQDILLLSMQMNTDLGTGGAASAVPVVSRLVVWERTPDGLTERTEVIRKPGTIFPYPYAVGAVDGDANLDLVTFEEGAPVAYLNGGSFKFTRTPLGETAADYKGKLVALVNYADRNHDGSADLLVILGEALDVQAIVLLGDGKGKLGAPSSAGDLIAALVPHGPTGMGFGVADVTGDGLADVLVQDPQGTDSAPILRLNVSKSATILAPKVELKALGFEFADVNADGKTDIVTTLNSRLSVLISGGNGTFETRDLGVDMAMPAAVDYVLEPSQGATPATVHVLYRLSACSTCDASCSGQCLFGACVRCLSDADCRAGRCSALACVP